MNVTRLVSRVSKPILCSIPARVAPIWCSVSPRLTPMLVAASRSITTDSDHLRLGNIGGKMKASDATRCLDIYLGRWVHDPKLGVRVLDQKGEEDKMQQQILRHLDIKNYLQYTRDNKHWKVEQGFVGDDKTISYKFVLGKKFTMLYPDNNYVKTLVHQDGLCMIWTFQPVDSPEAVLTVHTEIRENKLKWKTVYPDGLTVIRIYFKE